MTSVHLNEILTAIIPHLHIPDRHISFEFEGILLDFYDSDYLATPTSQNNIFEWMTESSGILIFESSSFLGLSEINLMTSVERFLRPVIDLLSLFLGVRLFIDRIFVFRQEGGTYHVLRGIYSQIFSSYASPPYPLMPTLYGVEAEHYLPLHSQLLANDTFRDHYHIIVNEYLQAKGANIVEIQILLYWFSIENFARNHARWVLNLNRNRLNRRIRSLRQQNGINNPGIVDYIQIDFAPSILGRPLATHENNCLRTLYDLRNAIAHEGEDISQRNQSLIIDAILAFQKLMTRLFFNAFRIPSQHLDWDERPAFLLLDYPRIMGRSRSNPRYQAILRPLQHLNDVFMQNCTHEGTLHAIQEQIPIQILFHNIFTGEFVIPMRYYPRIFRREDGNVSLQIEDFSLSFNFQNTRFHIASGSDSLTGTFSTSYIIINSIVP